MDDNFSLSFGDKSRTFDLFPAVEVQFSVSSIVSGDKKELCVDNFSFKRKQVHRPRQQIIPSVKWSNSISIQKGSITIYPKTQYIQESHNI